MCAGATTDTFSIEQTQTAKKRSRIVTSVAYFHGDSFSLATQHELQGDNISYTQSAWRDAVTEYSGYQDNPRTAPTHQRVQDFTNTRSDFEANRWSQCLTAVIKNPLWKTVPEQYWQNLVNEKCEMDNV